MNYPKEKLNWIPWQRYVLLLTVDQKKTMVLGRFRRGEGIRHIIERLSVYRGYELQIVDTKKIEGKPATGTAGKKIRRVA